MFGKICRPCRACTFGQNLGGGARFLISCYTNHTKIPPEYRFRFPIFFISLMRSLVAIVTTRDVHLSSSVFAYSRARLLVTASKTWLVSCMEYKQFRVQAFEREPGKWRANVRRGDGKPVKIVGREKLEKFVTRFDAGTAGATIAMAMAVIDAGMLVRDRVPMEKIWRRREQSSEFPTSVRPAVRAARRSSQDRVGPPNRARNSRKPGGSL